MFLIPVFFIPFFRSICSSLLTVSDLEEDLRVASAFLTKKRTSSVFTDSIDDLSSRLDDISNTGSLYKPVLMICLAD